ncbi:hypothetical protein GCM10010116_04060 [Microbispora rosea subsp. aerata]|nr:hypothetical protein GCM10010116_04060 [Microbispora rosea subsp. aerata]
MRSISTVSHSTVRLALAAASMAMLLTGCGVGLARSFAAVPQSPPPAPAQASPSPSPTPSGTDLGSCRDGDCEVQARQGDRIAIDPTLGVDEIVVAGIRGYAVRLTFTGTSTDVDGRDTTIGRRCYNGRCQVKGGLTISTSEPGRIGDVAVRLARVEGDTAELVLAPAAR